MRRPTRTRRLSIAALTSSLAFVIVACAGIRSFWTYDAWQTVVHGEGYAFVLECGTAGFVCRSGEAIPSEPGGHVHGDENPDRYAVLFGIREFQFHVSRKEAEIDLRIPVWPLLLLLLIAPVRWLIARPANAPAFPVITDAK